MNKRKSEVKYGAIVDQVARVVPNEDPVTWDEDDSQYNWWRWAVVEPANFRRFIKGGSRFNDLSRFGRYR